MTFNRVCIALAAIMLTGGILIGCQNSAEAQVARNGRTVYSSSACRVDQFEVTVSRSSGLREYRLIAICGQNYSVALSE